MAADVAPGILENVQKEFDSAMLRDRTIARLDKRIRAGHGTQRDLYAYAKREGELLSDALKRHITEETLPDGIFYQNIAERVLTPTTEAMRKDIVAKGVAVHTAVNLRDGIKIKGATPRKTNRAAGIVTRLTQPTPIAESKWLLGAPIVTMAQKSADDSVYANVQNLAASGYIPTITRMPLGNCCPWCEALAGSYIYREDELPDDFFRRHSNCTCVIETTWKGNVENAWTHQVSSTENIDKLRASSRDHLKRLDAANAEWDRQLRKTRSGDRPKFKPYATIRREHGLK